MRKVTCRIEVILCSIWWEQQSLNKYSAHVMESPRPPILYFYDRLNSSLAACCTYRHQTHYFFQSNLLLILTKLSHTCSSSPYQQLLTPVVRRLWSQAGETDHSSYQPKSVSVRIWLQRMWVVLQKDKSIHGLAHKHRDTHTRMTLGHLSRSFSGFFMESNREKTLAGLWPSQYSNL